MDEKIVEFTTDQSTNDRLDKVLVSLLPELSRV